MTDSTTTTPPDPAPAGPCDERESAAGAPANESTARDAPREIGGRGGLDPVRYGDWEKNGRCIDF